MAPTYELDTSSSYTSLHNREPPFGNKICHEKKCRREYDLHRHKVDGTRAGASEFMAPPDRYAFLDAKISKNFHAQRQGQIIMRENMKLLEKLATIQAREKTPPRFVSRFFRARARS